MMTAAAAVTTASGTDADPANHVESTWSKLKGPMLDAATKVCGLSKNQQWKTETWRWNEEVDKAIQEKHEEFGAGVGVRQGSVLSTLLFILVLKALSHEFCTGVPW